MTRALALTLGEINALLKAVGEHTDGNARDFYEWRLGTSGSRAEWNALLRAERKLTAAKGVAA